LNNFYLKNLLFSYNKKDLGQVFAENKYAT